MLIQSHLDHIRLLPALPDAWPQGRVKGLRARGGFEVDIDWRDGSLAEAMITSVSGQKLRLHAKPSVRVTTSDGREVPMERHGHVIEMATETGGRYFVQPI